MRLLETWFAKSLFLRTAEQKTGSKLGTRERAAASGIFLCDVLSCRLGAVGPGAVP